MTPVAKALWFIESHSAEDIDLDAVARCACVSRFHLLRAFNEATGYPVMRYVRTRRLSEAARRLAGGAGDILRVAVDSGYGSHEAFTRAFREQFGTTPEAVRNRGSLGHLELLEPMHMNDTTLPAEAPRYADAPLLLLAGLGQRYHCQDAGAAIPAQWQRFAAHLGHVPGQRGSVAYGVNHNSDESGQMDYLCAVEVSDFAALPEGFASLRVPAQRYAVFTHRKHISAIRGTWASIWNHWLPQSGDEVLDAPFFERYDQRFDPHSGNGEVEIWIPVARRS